MFIARVKINPKHRATPTNQQTNYQHPLIQPPDYNTTTTTTTPWILLPFALVHHHHRHHPWIQTEIKQDALKD